MQVIFSELYAEENQPDHDGQGQEESKPASFANLGTMYSHGHRKAAADKHGSVDCAQYKLHVGAAVIESNRMAHAVDGKGCKQPSEEHDFGDEEDPHTDGRSL